MEDFINEIVKQVITETDKTIYEFLEKNGYKVPKIITNEWLQDLKKQLEKEDKYVDMLQWTDFDNDKVVRHIIPFFNRISNPISQDLKNEVIERLRNAGNK